MRAKLLSSLLFAGVMVLATHACADLYVTEFLALNVNTSGDLGATRLDTKRVEEICVPAH